MTGRTPGAVTRGLRDLGEHLRHWRKLNGVTQALLAERANVSVPTVQAVEAGRAVSTENLARIAWVLGLLDTLVQAADPLASDVGRLRADQRLPQRVRTPK
jgi:transcriptional regulator with XRE-family HTH domain